MRYWIPGFHTDMVKRASQLWRQYRRQKLALIGLIIIGVIALVALVAPFVAPYGANQETTSVLRAPGPSHWLGTDNLGRDVFSRLIWGSQISFIFGLVVAGISLVVGVVIGAVAGYYGGWLDDLLSRVIEIFIMIPSLFLLIIIGALLGHSMLLIMVASGLTLWPSNARLTRAQVLSLKHEAYVEAAWASGVKDLRILFGHVLPNGIYPVIANSTLQVASAIILEASLSFLGVGDPNVSSWGQVLKSGQSYLTTAPWICAAPGVAIFLLVFAFNVCGDGLNHALNPRLRQRVVVEFAGEPTAPLVGIGATAAVGEGE